MVPPILAAALPSLPHKVKSSRSRSGYPPLTSLTAVAVAVLPPPFVVLSWGSHNIIAVCCWEEFLPTQ